MATYSNTGPQRNKALIVPLQPSRYSSIPPHYRPPSLNTLQHWPKFSRRSLTDEERLQICLYHNENMATKHKDIGGNSYYSSWMYSSATVDWQMSLDSNIWSGTEVKLIPFQVKQVHLPNDIKYGFKGSTPKGCVLEFWEETYSSYTG